MLSRNDQELELHVGNSAQLYTLAHAVRPKKTCNENKQFTNKNLFQPEISLQIKEELNRSMKSVLPRQPRSHLPMKMIVSKMATRKLSIDENKDPSSKLDLSTYRKYQLEPPPWRGRLHSTKRRQTSELENILSSMKQKCATLDLQPTTLKEQSTLKQKKLENLLSDYNIRGCDVMNTPRLNDNYNQLYRGKHQAEGNQNVAVVLDEDPLGVDSTERQTTEIDNLTNNTSPSITEPSTLDVDPEFVWNPIVVQKTPKYQLFPKEENESAFQECPFQLSPFNNYSQKQPSCFDTPTWESSSTCSEHTVAEERLQLTIFANRGDMSLFGHNFLRRSPHSPTNF